MASRFSCTTSSRRYRPFLLGQGPGVRWHEALASAAAANAGRNRHRPHCRGASEEPTAFLVPRRAQGFHLPHFGPCGRALPVVSGLAITFLSPGTCADPCKRPHSLLRRRTCRNAVPFLHAGINREFLSVPEIGFHSDKELNMITKPRSPPPRLPPRSPLLVVPLSAEEMGGPKAW